MQSKTIIYAKILRDALFRSPEAQWRKKAKLFRKLMKKRGEGRLTGRIMLEFRKLWEEREGKRAKLVHSFPLSASASRHWKKSAEARGFVYEEKVNPELLGGAALFLGRDFLIDNSVQGKLKRMRRYLETAKI